MLLQKKVGNDIYGVRSNPFAANSTADFHLKRNRRYHQYFHGYTEVRVPRPKGGFRIQRFYTQDWYVRQLPAARIRQAKASYLLLSLAGCIAYCRLVCLPGFSGNCAPLVAVGEIAAVVCMVLLAAALVGYLFTPEKMTWWERYSCSRRLCRFSMATAIAFAVTGALMAIHALGGAAYPFRELGLGMAVAITGLPLLAVNRLERKIPYGREKNRTILPEGDRFEIQ